VAKLAGFWPFLALGLIGRILAVFGLFGVFFIFDFSRFYCQVAE
jgi:hypothetical protein